MWLTESGRTAYLSAAAAGLVTERLRLGTAVAVAFPRSPMITASVAWELAEATEGRFTLGSGHAGQSPYRTPLLEQLRASRTADERVRPGLASDLSGFSG